MARAYSLDLRERVVAFVSGGETTRAAAAVFDVSVSSVVKWTQRVRATGSAAARQSQFVVYPGAQHAFHADYRPTYQQAAAEDGWKRCIGWLKANGAA